jgi:ABC-type multidrug transport system ATPase subunit
MGTPLLEVSNLTKDFGAFRAVDDLSFQVNVGDVFGFLGQNGAGKSTSLRMMLSLIRPTTGHISFSGLDLHAHRKAALRQVGAIIERPDLYKYLSAFDNLQLFARLSGVSAKRSRLLEQLEAVGLAQRFNSKVGTFSQGMKQRLGIAIAMVHDPALLILDEPTNGLDPQGIADMRETILRLNKERGKTILLSSHLLQEVEMISNRMLILHRGKKIMDGVVSECLGPDRNQVAIEATDSEQLKSALRMLGLTVLRDFSTHAVVINIPRSEVPALIEKLTHHQIKLLSVQPLQSLEDFFIQHTNAQS